MRWAHAVLTCCGLLLGLQAAAQTAPQPRSCPLELPFASRCFHGEDGQGSSYLIALPPGWDQQVLVMHAHGGPAETGAAKLERSEEDLKRWAVTLKAGYAWAGSTYRRGGYGVTMAAEDTERLRQIFVRQFGQPRRRGAAAAAGVAHHLGPVGGGVAQVGVAPQPRCRVPDHPGDPDAGQREPAEPLRRRLVRAAGDLVRDALVRVKVERQARVEALHNHARGALHRLGADAALRGEGEGGVSGAWWGQRRPARAWPHAAACWCHPTAGMAAGGRRRGRRAHPLRVQRDRQAPHREGHEPVLRSAVPDGQVLTLCSRRG